MSRTFSQLSCATCCERVSKAKVEILVQKALLAKFCEKVEASLAMKRVRRIVLEKHALALKFCNNFYFGLFRSLGFSRGWRSQTDCHSPEPLTLTLHYTPYTVPRGPYVHNRPPPSMSCSKFFSMGFSLRLKP